MSKVVDERVVEMRFDNRHFEKNIQGTLSTLDKFKQSLHLDGATKGLENVDKAAKKVDMTHLGKGLETVQAKFSALEVMGVTALANLTNSAVNAGKKIASSLLIEPKRDGFQEYELMLNSIQTTMAGTGKTAKEVENELKKLDEYADKTVYSTADMLTNLPKFTNAGVELEKATTAMIGIANATALAGGDASKASIAFYNLGQAIGTGYLTRMDYNSINNAGIATMEWKNQMVEAAIAQGTLTKVGEDAYKAGNKTLTLQQLFIDGLQEQWATTDVMMKVFGDYGDEQTEVGKKAYAAAQNIKTFTQMMESLKATAGTGWKDTWQIIFGDLDGATKLWTGVSNVISGILTSMSDFRNAVLESALGRGFSNLADRINGVLEPVSKTAENISEVVKTVEDYSKVVDQIISGDWGTGTKRWDALTEAGYDWAHAQNLVNEKLGDGTRHATNYKEAQQGLTGEQKKSTKTNAKLIAQLVKKSDAELESLGYTKDQIDALRELKKEADKTGYSVEEFVEKIDKINGRSLLIDSFKNIGKSIAAIFTAVKDAMTSIFKITPEGIGQKIYDLIAGFHKLTSYLVVSDDTAAKLERTFKGLFAALDIVFTLIGGPAKIAFKILSKLLGIFNVDVLDMTAKIGDVLVAFRDWIDSVLDFTEIFDKIEPALRKCLDKVKKWAGDLKTEFNKVAPDILSGLGKGIASGAKVVWDAIVNLGKSIIDKFCEILGIHSPSKVFIALGGFLISGLVMGITGSMGDVFESLKNAFKTIIEKLGGNIDQLVDIVINAFRTLAAFFPKLAIFNQIAWLITTFKSAGIDVTSNFGKGISEGASEIGDSVKDVFNSVKKAFGDLDWSKLSAGLWVASAFLPSVSILNIGAAISSVMALIGVNASEGLKEGITSGSSGIFGAIGKVITNIVEFVKDMLGIHSPSRVFMNIGKFLIAGLIVGIVGSKTGLFDALKKVVTFIKDKISDLKDWLGKVDFPEFKMEYILGAGVLVGLALFAKKIMTIGTDLGKGVKAFGNGVEAFGTVAKRLTGSLEPVKKGKWDSIATNALKLSAAIAILAASVYVLAQLDTGKLWSSVGAIAVLAGIVIAIGAIISKIDLKGQEFGKFSLMLVSISASLWIMASAIKKLEFLKDGDMGNIMIALGAMIGGLALVLAVLGKLVKGKTAQNIDKAGITILKISSALLLLTFVIKQISKLDEGALIKGGIAIATFSVIVAGLIAATRLAGKKIDSAGKTILKISAAMLLMVFTAKILSGMDLPALIKGGVAVAAFGVMIAGLIWATKLAAGNDVQKVGGTILAVSSAIMMIGLTAAILSMVSVEGLLKGILAVTALSGIMVGLIAATKLATDKEMKGVATTILAMSVAIGIMGATAVILGMISIPGLIKGVTAVSILGLVLTAMIWATRGASECKGNIMMMAVAIGIMAASVAVLSFLDPNKLAGATTCMSVLMGIFAIMIKVAGQAKRSMGNIIVLTLAVAAIGGVIYALTKYTNVNEALTAAKSLSILLLSMTAVLGILAIISKFGANPIMGVLSLLAMAVPLLAFVGVLALMQNVQNAANNAMVLTALATAMTLLLIPLTIIGAFGMAGLPYLGVLALLAMAVPLVAFVGVLALMENLSNAISNANALINLMTTMTTILVVLSIIGPLAFIGVKAMMAFEALMIATGAMAIAIGALMDKFPALEKFLNGGIEILKRLAGGIGEIISSFAVGLTSGLPEIGTNLSAFMNNLSGFIAGANMIGDDLGDKITTLAKAIVLLTAADLIAGISSLLQNGSSFAQLGSDLSAFMINAMPFMMGLSMVKPESLTAVKALAEAILILTGTDLLNSLASFITGGSSLADFGAELAAFGPHMATYAAAVAGIDSAAVEASANAGKALAEMAAALPNSGGVVGWFSGENDMTTFGSQLVAFGTALKMYSIAVTGIVLEPIMNSVDAGKALAEMAEVIPNLGGVVGWFTGDNDLATFGNQIILFGMALKQYSLIVTGIVLEPIMNSVEAGKALAGLNEAIPNLGGMVTWFTGDNDFATFGAQIVSFGTALSAYSLAVSTLNVPAIMLSVVAATHLAKLAEALPTDGGFWSLFKDDKIDLSTFGTEIEKLGKGIAKYSKAVSGINAGAVSTSITNANRILSFIKKLDGLDTGSVETFSKALGTLGKTSVNKFIKAFTSSTSKLNNIGSKLIKEVANGAKSANGNLMNVVNSTVKAMNNAFSTKQAAFRNIGMRLMTAFVSGINSKKSQINLAMKTVAGKAVQGARDKYQNFYNAGSYAVSGFVNGIYDNKYKAVNAGTSLGKAAYKAAKAAIESNSPSKKFMELGMFADQGLAKGLLSYAYVATNASAALGKGIVESMQDELDINSPARVIKDEVGRYIVEGLAEGITSDMSAEEAAEQKARNIADAFKTEMAKYDTDMTTSDLEYDLWEVHNESATAAEKTAQKAASIYKRVAAQTEQVALAQAEYEITFKELGENSEKTQEAYNKWIEEQIALNNETKKLLDLRNESIDTANEAAELAQSKADLEYELWETQNPKAGETATNARNLELVLSKIPEQAKMTGLAQAKYEDAVKRYGETSNEAKKLYNDYLKSQIDLASLLKEADASYEDALYTQREAMTAYSKLMRENKAELLESGMSIEEIEQWARETSGYDPAKLNELMASDAKSATTQAMDIVAATYQEYAGQTFGDLITEGEQYGKVYGESIASGVTSATPGIGSAVETVANACVVNSTAQQENWVELGKQFANKFAQGIANAIDTVTQATITLVTSAYQAAVDFINDPNNVGGFTPTISPIVDLSNIQNGAELARGMFATSTAALADINVRLANDSIIELHSIAEEMRKGNEDNHSELISAIKDLKGDLHGVVESIDGMYVRLDSNALVGELASKIDRALGEIADYKGRGN